MHSHAESPANLPNDLFIGVDFKNNNMKKVMKYGDPKCRFMATDGTKVYTDGEFVYYPLQGVAYNDNDKHVPNSIHCSTPVWQLHDGFTAEQVKLDVTINGQNYAGDFDFNFT